MESPSRVHSPMLTAGAVLLVGLGISLLAACVPGSGLPSQASNFGSTTTPEASASGTPAATSSGGSVVPVITF